MLHLSSALTCTDLTYHHPDGTAVLDGVNFSLGPGRHGVVGENGAGKSTLLKLIAEELVPTSGTVQVDGELAMLPQEPAAVPDQTVSDLLGTSTTLAALGRIESGSVREEDFDAVGDDWDIVERLQAMLSRFGLDGLELDRPTATLSGGELMLLSLTALLLRRPSVLLLDEPTNNLDPASREEILNALRQYEGAVVLVTHDEGAVEALDPERVVLLPDGDEDLWSEDYLDLISLA